MDTARTFELSPKVRSEVPNRRQMVIDLWIQLGMSGDSGATTWEVLDVLRDRVMNCLAVDLMDEAERTTIIAMMLVSGSVEH